MILKPPGEKFHLGNILRPGTVVTVDPTLHLPAEKALRSTEVVQTRFPPIDGVKLHQRLHHRPGDLPAKGFRRFHARGKSVIQNRSFPPFHHVKGSSDNGWIPTNHKGFRRQRKRPVQLGQQGRLPHHVMGLRWNRSQGGPAQNRFPTADADQISQIGSPRWKLTDLERLRAEALQVLPQIPLHLLPVKFLSLPDGDRPVGRRFSVHDSPPSTSPAPEPLPFRKYKQKPCQAPTDDTKNRNKEEDSLISEEDLLPSLFFFRQMRDFSTALSDKQVKDDLQGPDPA